MPTGGSLQVVDLSGNKLSGSLKLYNSPRDGGLQVFNVSGNWLRGEVEANGVRIS